MNQEVIMDSSSITNKNAHDFCLKKKKKSLSLIRNVFKNKRLSIKLKYLKRRKNQKEEEEDEERNEKNRFSFKRFFGLNNNSLLNRSFIIKDSTSDSNNHQIKNLFKENQLFEMRIFDAKKQFECKFFKHHHHHHHHRHHHCKCNNNQQKNTKIVNLLNNAFYESASILL
jgi:ABC-type nickel/cobalt efflux system permease component RcnA